MRLNSDSPSSCRRLFRQQQLAPRRVPSGCRVTRFASRECVPHLVSALDSTVDGRLQEIIPRTIALNEATRQSTHVDGGSKRHLDFHWMLNKIKFPHVAPSTVAPRSAFQLIALHDLQTGENPTKMQSSDFFHFLLLLHTHSQSPIRIISLSPSPSPPTELLGSSFPLCDHFTDSIFTERSSKRGTTTRDVSRLITLPPLCTV